MAYNIHYNTNSVAPTTTKRASSVNRQSRLRFGFSLAGRFPLWVLILFVYVNTASGQSSTYNQVDQKGLRQGAWRGYFASGSLRYEGNFIDNKPTGLFTFFFPEGQKRAELIHHIGEASVKATFYHRNGNMLGEGFFVNRQKDGLWRYFSETGLLMAESFYQNNLNHGVWKTFYPGGQTGEIVTWHRGQRNGPWEKFLPDGTLLLRANFANDMLNGRYQLFHLNGQLRVIGHFVNDKRDDVWLYYADNGLLEKKITYDNGIVVKEQIHIESPEPDIPLTPERRSIPENPFGF